jgi:hypothetical protein
VFLLFFEIDPILDGDKNFIYIRKRDFYRNLSVFEFFSSCCSKNTVAIIKKGYIEGNPEPIPFVFFQKLDCYNSKGVHIEATVGHTHSTDTW